MRRYSITNSIVIDNFIKMKYISLLLAAYVVVILISDFAPINLWNDEVIYLYRLLDIFLAVVSILAILFFWLYKKENYVAKDLFTKVIVLLILIWSAAITGVEFSALGFSTLVLVMLLSVFFLYIDILSSIIFFSSSFLTLGITLYFGNQNLENFNSLIFTSFILSVFAVLISRRNYNNKVNDLLKNSEMEALNSELKLIKEELEFSNEDLKVTNKKLSAKTNKLETTLQELSSTQAKLVQSEKMASIGVMAAGIAHEINNPVNFISSSLTGLKNNLTYLSDYIEQNSRQSELGSNRIIENLAKENADIEQIIEMLHKSAEIINIGVERTTKIIRGLRSFARTGNKEPELYDLHENIDITLLILNNQLKDRIEIVKNYDKIPRIVCYPGQINQVLMNILSNAIQAIEGKGKIIIATSGDNDMIRISIKDTGKGISENFKDQVFDPFFTTKKVGQGTGLGLSISYNIVKEHNGGIFMESNEGEGSTFIIELPVRQ